jgi:hypothetical protein
MIERKILRQAQDDQAQDDKDRELQDAKSKAEAVF